VLQIKIGLIFAVTLCLILNFVFMAKNEKTSQQMATLAGKILRDPKSSLSARRLAACVLTQAADKKAKR